MTGPKALRRIRSEREFDELVIHRVELVMKHIETGDRAVAAWWLSRDHEAIANRLARDGLMANAVDRVEATTARAREVVQGL